MGEHNEANVFLKLAKYKIHDPRTQHYTYKVKVQVFRDLIEIIMFMNHNWSKVLTLGFRQDLFVLMMNLGEACSFRKVVEVVLFVLVTIESNVTRNEFLW